jgi:tRNA pseudouridine38-40 synthase
VASDGTIRFRLLLHYDGSRYHGWQLQPVEPTVQGELEAALARLSGARRTVVGAGRTDRGVHATGQVASVDLPERWDAPTLRRALNAVLPRDIWVERADVADPSFHPRFDAVARSYAYRVGMSERSASPFFRPWCWALRRPVDRDRLAAAALELPGDHSFRAFAKAGQEERGDRCIVDSAAWEPWEDLGMVFRVTANRYLHHMVRYLVGTMVAIGRGERPAGDLRALLRDDPTGLKTSPPAPPEGLFLTAVEYPSRGAPGAAPASRAPRGQASPSH